MAATILTAGLHDYLTGSIESLAVTTNGIRDGAVDNAVAVATPGGKDSGRASLSLRTAEFGTQAPYAILKDLDLDDAIAIVRSLHAALEDPAGPRVLDVEALATGTLAARRAAALDAGFRFVLAHDAELLTRLEDA